MGFYLNKDTIAVSFCNCIYHLNKMMNRILLEKCFQASVRKPTQFLIKSSCLQQSRVAKFTTGSSSEEAELDARIKKQFLDYVLKIDEPTANKRARLLWQSRKRGIAENCLLLSTFSAEHLNKMTEEELETYDRILNDYINEWDLYYWMVGTKEVPVAYESNIMDMLKVHAKNEQCEKRFKQPDLH